MAREDELAAARRFVAGLPTGPAALLLEGEAGAGKTILWELAVAEAEGTARVLRAQPSEAERQLSFAALGDLVGDAVEQHAAGLPAPQRHALEVALLLEPGEGVTAERRAVALGLLGVLRELAVERPVLVAIDDVQWVDPSTSSALVFALRRLRDEPIRLLGTQRVEPGVPTALSLDRAPQHLPVERVGVGPLSLAALQRVLHLHTGALFTRPVLRRIHSTSGGNPFFALELARALGNRTPEPDAPLPVPDQLGELLSLRLSGLPEQTRELLLVAALVGQPTVAQLEAACGEVTGPALDAAVEARVLTVTSGQVRFTHPLLASVVVDRAGETHRREVHRRLATVPAELEKQVRHLALATAEPDRRVAARLVDAAATAARRGAPEAAAELAGHAIRLTPPDSADELALRTVEAASYSYRAGESARALQLMRRAVQIAPEGPTRARALYELSVVENLASDRNSVPVLCRAGLAQAGDDPLLSAYLHSQLAWGLVLARRDIAEAAQNARMAAQQAGRAGDTAALTDCLSGLSHAELLLGDDGAALTMQRALALGDRDEPRSIRLPIQHAGLLSLCADQLGQARSLYLRVLGHARDHGDESAPAWVLMRLAEVELLAGEWARAREHAAAGHEQAVQTEQPPLEAAHVCLRALVAAHCGEVEEARAAALEGAARSGRLGDGIGERLALRAAGLIELSAGDPATAVKHLARMREANNRAGIVEPGENRHVGDLAEALIELDRVDEAELVLAGFEPHAQRLGRSGALAVTARCRALAAARRDDREAALAMLDRALALHAEAPLPFERARSLLTRGVLLRQVRRLRDARAALTEAQQVFAGLGAALWVRRAQRERERIGGRAPASDGLTPSEQRVAELVATGLTNRQVAEELVVTERTVESHLSHVYRKLGVRSRTELAHRYASGAERIKVP